MNELELNQNQTNDQNNDDKAQQALAKLERKQRRRQQREQVRQQAQKRKKMRQLARWSLILVGLITIIGLVVANSRGDNQGNNDQAAILTIRASDQVVGNRDAPVVLIEYSDFQCPACAAYSKITKQLRGEYQDKIAFVYRHFPLKQIHPNAELLAAGAEAAGQQGQFWAMHDLLFEHRDELASSRDVKEAMTHYAQEINLNLDQFTQDLNAKTTADYINSQYDEAIRLGLNSTPTFFLNGEKLTSVRSYEQFQVVIEHALKQKP